MINVSQAFHRTSANPIDESLALTKAQMLTVNDNLMPSKYLTVCQDDGKIYLYDKSNEVDVETGKFREFESGTTITIDPTPTESSTNAVSSGGTYTALTGKVDKVTGKGLSTNDYTDAEKTKLAGIDLSNYIPTSQKGVSNGVATLGANGKVPMSQIPNGLDETIFGYRNPADELFYEDAEFTEPITPEAGIFYYDELSTNFYRWTGTAYVSFTDGSTGLVLGEVTGTAYDGGKGKANRDAITAIKDGQTIDSFGDVETALADKVDKVTGKGLSTNDFTDAYKQTIDDLDTDISNKQNKTLSSAQTIEGTSVTTVEGGVTATRTHTEKAVTDQNGVHGFKVTTSNNETKLYYKSGNSWEEIEVGSSTQVSTLPTASQDNVGSVLQYIGSTTSVSPIYVHGFFYECVEDGGSYSWENVPVMDVQEIQKTALPTASANELGNIYQYVGSTTQTYRKGYWYECEAQGTEPETYAWAVTSVQPSSGGQTIQYDAMPTASSTNVGQIIQYTGATTQDYTNGFFYKCVAQGTEPETYAWEAQTVQEGGGSGDSRIGNEVTKVGFDFLNGKYKPYIIINKAILPPTLSDATWSDIKDISDAYYRGDTTLENITNVWSVGDTIDIDVSEIASDAGEYGLSAQPEQTITMAIGDFNVDYLTTPINDKDKALITFIPTEKLTNNSIPNSETYDVNYPSSGLHLWLNDVYFNALGANNMIKEVNKTWAVNSSWQSQNPQQFTTKIWVPNVPESIDVSHASGLLLNTQYPYWSTVGNRVYGNTAWWIRDRKDTLDVVVADGTTITTLYTSPAGIVPCFCV